MAICVMNGKKIIIKLDFIHVVLFSPIFSKVPNMVAVFNLCCRHRRPLVSVTDVCMVTVVIGL